MNILKKFLKSFKYIDCYCVCHDKGRNIVHKGGVIVVSCEHCVGNVKARSGTWGTATSY